MEQFIPRPEQEQSLDPEAQRNEAIRVLDESVTHLRFIDPKTKKIPRVLGPEDQWVLDSVTGAMTEIPFSENRNTYTIKGTTFEEGVPVDDLIGWLEQQRQTYQEANEEDIPEIMEYEYLIDKLTEYSLPFWALSPSPDHFAARVDYEQSLIAADRRNTNNTEHNHQLAEATMQKRLEFRPPLVHLTPKEIRRRALQQDINGDGDTQIGSDAADEEGGKLHKKIIVPTSVATAFGTTIGVVEFHHDSLTRTIGMTAGAAIAVGVTAIQERRARKHDRDASEGLTLTDYAKTAAAPVAAGLLVPYGGEKLLQMIPDSSVGFVKGTIGGSLTTIALLNYKRMSKLFIGPGKRYISALLESKAAKEKKFVPFTVEETEGLLLQSQKVIRDALDYTLDVHPFRSLLPDPLEEVFMNNPEELQEQHRMLAKMLNAYEFESNSDAIKAFIHYEAMYSFVKYLDSLKEGIDSSEKQQRFSQAESICLDTLYKLDTLALQAIYHPKDSLSLSDNENDELERKAKEQRGMAYLFAREENGPEADMTLETMREMFFAYEEDSRVRNRQTENMIEHLQAVEARDSLKRRIQKIAGRKAGGGTQLIFDGKEAAAQVRKKAVKKVKDSIEDLTS